MRRFFQKAHSSVYKLLKDGGRQSEFHDIVEYIISAAIVLNVAVIVCDRMEWSEAYRSVINAMQTVFFIFFLAEYVLRVWIADLVMHDKKHPVRSRVRYMLSFGAVINLLALLPVMLPNTVIDFRIFRVLRLLRISRIKSLRRNTDILVRVLKQKGPQLLASLMIVFTFMLASAVIIYDLEHEAQPAIFTNVLSGLWWSMQAVTTIGYGDMAPVTSTGRVFASLLSVMGVLFMAIPISILTSGFFAASRNTHHKGHTEDEHKDKDE